MCGIAGIRRFDGRPVDEGLLRAMTDRLRHRGPDDDGTWHEGSVGLGHRRLAVIDPAGPPQPMAGAGDRLRVCFNGEVFNYRRLRERLPYPYRTSGDTEVLLAAHHHRGADAVHLLEGQFAYAVHDAGSGELLLVRDRLGVLPLYYYADDRLLAFASEIKALLPALPGPPRVDTASLDAYLAARAVPAPFTLVDGVRKVPAGHRVRVAPDGGVRVERYWSLPEPSGDGARSADDAVDRVEQELLRAVEAATVADVPVGAYLSGGVDSSLIVALMTRLRGGDDPVRTFAAGFGDPRHDELPNARRVADLLGTVHTEVRVGPSDFTDLWPHLAWHRDAPVSEPSDVAVHKLAVEARRAVTVVLSGEGSDELFGGYPKHRAAPWVHRAARVPGRVRVPLVRALEQRLPPVAARARIALRVLAAADEQERARAWFAPFTAAERAELVGGRPQHPATPAPRTGGVLDRMLADDLLRWLPDNLLERGDRMSMAASLELRPPFLDHRLVELAATLPARVKVRRGTTKWVLKEVARRHLPAEVVDRRKVGFRVPLDAWLRGELRPMARELLDTPDSFVASLADRATVRTLLDRHDSGRADEAPRLWTLLSLEVWHRAVVRGAAGGGAPGGVAPCATSGAGHGAGPGRPGGRAA